MKKIRDKMYELTPVMFLVSATIALYSGRDGVAIVAAIVYTGLIIERAIKEKVTFSNEKFK